MYFKKCYVTSLLFNKLSAIITQFQFRMLNYLIFYLINFYNTIYIEINYILAKSNYFKIK